jgi:hypothetical protein
VWDILLLALVLGAADGCSAGKFWVKPRSAKDTPCSECPAGKYQPRGGQRSCLRCPAGRSSSPSEPRCSINTPAPTPLLPMCKRGQYVHTHTMGLLGGKSVLSRSSVYCRMCPKGKYQPNAARTDKCWACPRGKTSTDQRVDCSIVKNVDRAHTPAPTPWAVRMEHVVIKNGDEVPNDYEKHDKAPPGTHFSKHNSEDASTAAVQPESGDDDWLSRR